MRQSIACAILAGAAAGYLGSVGATGGEQRPNNGPSTGSRPAASSADAPAPERSPPTDPHELAVAYAEVYLKLAKLDLQKMVDLQNRIPGATSASQIDRVEGLVRVAEAGLRLAKEGKVARAQMNVVRARETLRTAEQMWKTAQQVRASANAISDVELSRIRITVELERLGLARAEAVAKTDSPLDDLALEMDQIRDEILRLRYRFEAITARR
jgi:hypothetical protein